MDGAVRPRRTTAGVPGLGARAGPRRVPRPATSTRAREHFPWAEVKRLAAAGLLASRWPEERGGQGGDVIALGLACEEVGYADPNLGYVLFATNLAVPLLAGHAEPAVRNWAARIAAGDALACFAVTEPGGGSDAAAQTTRAERVGGGWRL